jgi:hypothetical protein
MRGDRQITNHHGDKRGSDGPQAQELPVAVPHVLSENFLIGAVCGFLGRENGLQRSQWLALRPCQLRVKSTSRAVADLRQHVAQFGVDLRNIVRHEPRQALLASARRGEHASPRRRFFIRS